MSLRMKNEADGVLPSGSFGAGTRGPNLPAAACALS
jgi:hypothetical protein